MASIASPRPMPASGASTPTASSQRTSLDTARTASPARSATAATPTAPTHARRNRAALRDYYNLKPQAAAATASSTSEAATSSTASVTSASEDANLVPDSELDKPGFDSAAYVQRVLEREGLQGVLKIESALLNEIRELDGERKALVYDNYSKLIAATETIKGMRANMAPLGASTGELKGMVGRIAGTAGELAQSARAGKGDVAEGEDQKAGVEKGADREKARRQKETVRWVVGSPARFRKLVDEGEREKAEKEWSTVQKLLDKWAGVDGVQQVREECMEVLAEGTSSEEEE